MTPLQQKVRELFDYDPDTGVCTWLVNRHKAKAGEPIDDRYKYSKGYKLIGFHGKPHLLHRLIFLWMTGEFPKHEVDHINGDKDDNRWSNLRDITRAEQMWNRSGWGKSSYTGVTWYPASSKWQAHITIEGTQMYLGRFDTEEAAFQAYLNAKNSLDRPGTRYQIERDGVTKIHDAEWVVRVQTSDELLNIGKFSSESKAKEAYMQARILFGHL